MEILTYVYFLISTLMFAYITHEAAKHKEDNPNFVNIVLGSLLWPFTVIFILNYR